MFNTPFATGFQGFPFGYQGHQGFQGFNPSWNQSFGNQYTPFSGYQGNTWNGSNTWNSSPWSSYGNQGGNWDWNTPQNWYAPQSFQGFDGFQGQGWNSFPGANNGWSNNAQTGFPFAGFNGFNSPFASQYGPQFGSQFAQTPFGYNWWNAENAPTESTQPTYAQAPFGYNPFAGFNPAAATQAA